MIQPTIGRVVLYHGPESTPDQQPNAAIITYVWSDTCVNLAVFDANGVASSQTSVFLYQGASERPSASYCEWMPYQLGQAAKTEALVAAAPAVSDMNPLLVRLAKHGIVIQPEDLEEAAGSGSERWGTGETWAESHDEAGAPV